MVATERNLAGDGYRFVIRPNSSLSWKGNIRIFTVAVIVILVIAALFSSKGLWLVIPFAGFEILVLGAALYACACKAAEREVIDIGPDRVVVERGRYEPSKRFEFVRAWARVRLDASASKSHPGRLLIGAHGNMIEIGSCLVEEERKGLANSLSRELKKK
jgi:uncharacterized membrane protein